MAALPILAHEREATERGPAAGTLEHVACAVCGAEDAREEFVKHGRAVVRCATCGLAYVNPRPPWSEVARIYRDENYYRNDNTCDFGYGDYLGEQRDLLLPLFERRVEGIERFQPERGRLLDVGCATGILLEAARARGWSVEGSDVSEFAVAYCRQRGLAAHCGGVETARFASARFDAVVMDDTIEHLPDPRVTLLELHRILAPGGLLTINTCDEGGWLRRVMRTRWFHYKPLEHLFYFDRANLARLLEDTGFAVLDTTLSGKIVTFRYLCQRLRTYSPLGSRLSLATLGRLPGAEAPFFLPIGEFTVFARRH